MPACTMIKLSGKGDIMEQKHWKKLAAPIIIAVIIAAYFLIVSTLCLFLPQLPFIVKLLMAALPALLAGVVLYVLIERIEEIRSGEEDDLSQY